MNFMQVGKYHLDFIKKTYIMGILNVTPDSFSDGGKFDRVDSALKHAEQLVRDGADIIDIGGESTRPGAKPVLIEEELERVLPIVEKISREIDRPISIDTYKAKVAEEALAVGAHIINDVWGGQADRMMADVAARSGAPIILMHNRKVAEYGNFMQDVITDLFESVCLMEQAGVSRNQMILDPGFGFGKTMAHNLEVMRNLDKIVALGFPVLLGTSRKGTIGKVLGDVPTEERLEGTGATVCYGIAQGCQIMRVHDVKEMTKMAKMMDAMLGKLEVNE